MEILDKAGKFKSFIEKGVNIFKVELVNLRNQPIIKPIYTGIEELKLLCEKALIDKGIHTKNSSIMDKTFHPILWIDCQFKTHNN